ncbi:hypothetical protein [Streptomyces sp. NPDC052042]
MSSPYAGSRRTFLDGSEAVGWISLGIVPLDFFATRSGLVESLIRHNPGL